MLALALPCLALTKRYLQLKFANFSQIPTAYSPFLKYAEVLNG